MAGGGGVTSSQTFRNNSRGWHPGNQRHPPRLCNPLMNEREDVLLPHSWLQQNATPANQANRTVFVKRRVAATEGQGAEPVVL